VASQEAQHAIGTQRLFRAKNEHTIIRQKHKILIDLHKVSEWVSGWVVNGEGGQNSSAFRQ